MKLAHPELKLTIEDSEKYINVLIIENEDFFRQTVQDIYDQINGLDGKYVISKNNEPIQWSKNAELITQYVPFEINRKTLITKLYNKMKKEALDNFYIETCEVSGTIMKYLALISSKINADMIFDDSIDIAGIFKLANIRFDDSGDSIAEKLVSYMLNVRELEGDKWFIAVGLKSYIGKAELTEMYKTVFLNKLKLLLIESSEKEAVEGEKKYVIDKDLCEIY